MEVGIKEVKDFISSRVGVAILDDLRILCEETITKLSNTEIKEGDFIEVYFGYNHLLSRYNGKIVKVNKVEGKSLFIELPDDYSISVTLKRVKRRVNADEIEKSQDEVEV